MRSMNSTRLASWVSGSWNARSASSLCSAASRSSASCSRLRSIVEARRRSPAPGGVWSSARARRPVGRRACRAPGIRRARSVDAEGHGEAARDAEPACVRRATQGSAAALARCARRRRWAASERAVLVVLDGRSTRMTSTGSPPRSVVRKAAAIPGLGDQGQLGAIGAEASRMRDGARRPTRRRDREPRAGASARRVQEAERASSRDAPPPMRPPAIAERDDREQQARRARWSSRLAEQPERQQVRRRRSGSDSSRVRSMPPWRSSCSISLAGSGWQRW